MNVTSDTTTTGTGAQADARAARGQGVGIGLRRPEFDPNSDGELGVAELDALIDALSSRQPGATTAVGTVPEAAWGESLQSYLRDPSARTPAARPEVKKVEAPPRAPAPAPVVARGPVDPAVAAARALQMARNYLTAGNESVAREKLKKVIDAYPQTPAAEEAAALLKQLAAAVPGNAQAMAQ
jgi:hypothetical protein